MTKSESPKADRTYAAERIANLINHGMSDNEIITQTMFEIDPLTLIGVIRDLMLK